MYYRSGGLLSFILSILAVFMIFYGFILFLPIILLVIGGYFLYIYYKAWRLKSYLRQQNYQFDFEEEKKEQSDVIDAEFEILDEKMRK